MRSRKAQWRTLQAAFIFAALVGVFMVAATSSRSPSLSHVDAAIVSGDPAGNYHAIVARLAAEAERRQGRIRNIASAGPVENMTRLDAARAVRDMKLQIVDFGIAGALAHRLPAAREGVIKAGHYDPVRGLPSHDKRVIDVDPLVIGNGCARESVTQGIITALARVFPGLV